MNAEPVTERLDLTGVSEILPLLRDYCRFYGTQPRDDRLVALCRSLLDDPSQGVQILGRREGLAVGFATIFWSWSTLDAARVGILHDLYTEPEHRRHGVARALIEASTAACRKRGVPKLVWDTAPDNDVARRLYESLGASSSEWISYEIEAW